MSAPCAKIFLIIVNIIFLVLGLCFVAGGIFIAVGEDYYQEHLDKFQDQIPDIASGVGLSVNEDKNKDASLDLGSILQTLWIVLLTFGLFMTITAIFGMCGACCEKTAMLVVYIVIVGIILLAQLAVVIIIATHVFDERIKKDVKEMIRKKYGGIDDFSVESLSMNYVMLKYECCGVDDYNDFKFADNWVRNRTLDLYGYEANYIMEIPLACCETSGKFPKLDIKNINCTIAPSNTVSNWKNGCWDVFQDQVDSNKIIFYGVFSAVLAFELVCVICSGCIIKKSKNSSKVGTE